MVVASRICWGGPISRFAGSSVSGKGVVFALIKSFRLYQWAKNLLVFVPLVLGGKIEDSGAWIVCAGGFVALGVMASSTYLLNDLFDLAHDREHWSKRNRPLARGDLPVGLAVAIAPVGILASIAFALAVDRGAAVVLALYAILTMLYSIRLKRVPILDVLVLATLFSFRLLLGIELAEVRPSPWLIVFSMFLFTSLSFAKRHIEIGRNDARGRKGVSGRGYVVQDLPLVFAAGVASASGAILIMVLYLIEDAFGHALYHSPAILWAMPAILFLWLGRIWLLVGRDELDDDPLLFAVKDNVSLGLGLAMVVAFLCAWKL